MRGRVVLEILSIPVSKAPPKAKKGEPVVLLFFPGSSRTPCWSGNQAHRELPFLLDSAAREPPFRGWGLVPLRTQTPTTECDSKWGSGVQWQVSPLLCSPCPGLLKGCETVTDNSLRWVSGDSGRPTPGTHSIICKYLLGPSFSQAIVLGAKAARE